MTAKEFWAALAAPFPADVVKWKPQSVKGNRALAVAYIDARDVEDRLNRVCGIDSWEDAYRELSDGCMLCELTIFFGERGVTRSDVGAPSDQPDKGDKKKAATSDALKRAAVKFGVGRYLYRLESHWVDFDPSTKKLTKTPALPAWALPDPNAKPSGTDPEPIPPKKRELPRPGAEFVARIKAADEQMARDGLCNSGGLFLHLKKAGEVEQLPEKLEEWDAKAIKAACRWVENFRTAQRAKKPEQQPAGQKPEGKPAAEQQKPAGTSGSGPAPTATAAQVRAAGLDFFGDGEGGQDEFLRWLVSEGVQDMATLDKLPPEFLGRLLKELTVDIHA